MALYVLTNCKFWLGDHDLSGHLNQMALEYAAELQDDTVFGDDTRSRIGGLKTIQANLEGFYDTAAAPADIDSHIFPKVGTQGIVTTVGPTDGADASPAYFFQANEGEYNHEAVLGEILSFSARAEASEGPLVSGTVMHNATRTTTGNGTARQLGLVAAGESVYASLHVITASSGDTLDVIVQSDDNSGMTSATNRLTFTQATGITSEWKSLAGAIANDDWWRVNYTIGGAGPGFEFICAIGIV